jgi:hypothetical protein
MEQPQSLHIFSPWIINFARKIPRFCFKWRKFDKFYIEARNFMKFNGLGNLCASVLSKFHALFAKARRKILKLASQNAALN